MSEEHLPLSLTWLFRHLPWVSARASISNRFVSCGDVDTGVLSADYLPTRRGWLGKSDVFHAEWVKHEGRNFVALRGVNGKYWEVVNPRTGELRCVGCYDLGLAYQPALLFSVMVSTTQGWFALKSCLTDHFVTISSDSVLACCSPRVSLREQFVLVIKAAVFCVSTGTFIGVQPDLSLSIGTKLRMKKQCLFLLESGGPKGSIFFSTSKMSYVGVHDQPDEGAAAGRLSGAAGAPRLNAQAGFEDRQAFQLFRASKAGFNVLHIPSNSFLKAERGGLYAGADSPHEVSSLFSFFPLGRVTDGWKDDLAKSGWLQYVPTNILRRKYGYGNRKAGGSCLMSTPTKKGELAILQSTSGTPSQPLPMHAPPSRRRNSMPEKRALADVDAVELRDSASSLPDATTTRLSAFDTRVRKVSLPKVDRSFPLKRRVIGEHMMLILHHVLILWPDTEAVLGALVVTNYRLIFAPHLDFALSVENLPSFSTALGMVDSVFRSGMFVVSEGRYKCFTIRFKDFAEATFSTVPHSPHKPSLVALKQLIMDFASPSDLSQSFAFTHFEACRSNSGTLRLDALGRFRYSAEGEYTRLRLDRAPWRVSPLNYIYSLCESYPSIFVVPMAVSDEELKGTALFRTKNRLPVVVWRHAETHSVLVRCSQPRTGMRGRRSAEDERLVGAMRDSVASSARLSRAATGVCLIDPRPYANVMANTIAGYGVEGVDVYGEGDTERMFLGLPNIHVMRKCRKKLAKVCGRYAQAGGSDAWEMDEELLGKVIKTGWLDHISKALSGAHKAAVLISTTNTVCLTHCSDGWDRTSQIVALTELLLDPFYRTLRGFGILVEKEFVSFGHKFRDRLQLIRTAEGKEGSPIFVQFIDACWQLLRQFPNAFEFTSELLVCILDNAYSCRFGTFLCNSEQERRDLDVMDRTHSLWAFMSEVSESFVNVHYLPDRHNLICPVSAVGADGVVFWGEFYLSRLSSKKLPPADFATFSSEFASLQRKLVADAIPYCGIELLCGE